MTLSTDIQHNSIECHYAEFRYAECRICSNVILSVVILSVVVPRKVLKKHTFKNIYPLLNSGFKLNHKQKVSKMTKTYKYDSLD